MVNKKMNWPGKIAATIFLSAAMLYAGTKLSNQLTPAAEAVEKTYSTVERKVSGQYEKICETLYKPFGWKPRAKTQDQTQDQTQDVTENMKEAE